VAGDTQSPLKALETRLFGASQRIDDDEAPPF
jgi:hypothetical protein